MDARPLLETVTHRIAETLHVPRISVLLREGHGYCLQGAGDGASSVVLEPEARSIAHLRAARGPAVVYFDDPDAWLRDAPAPERQALRQLDAQLLLPLTGRDDLIGVMALGPKRSEEPYSKTDLHLLQSVADQTGLAIENSRLLSSLAEEAARRERFNRELEIAREVQERLFPQSDPSIAGLDCAGHCRPAQGVGGDYYDLKVDPGGHETVLHTFTGGIDGKQPVGGVARDPAGNLYGTTQNGGFRGAGVLYKITRLSTNPFCTSTPMGIPDCCQPPA